MTPAPPRGFRYDLCEVHNDAGRDVPGPYRGVIIF
jgi:hypothetical protein